MYYKDVEENPELWEQGLIEKGSRITLMDAWVGEIPGDPWHVCTVIDRGSYLDLYMVDLLTLHIDTVAFVKSKGFGFNDAAKQAEIRGYRKRF